MSILKDSNVEELMIQVQELDSKVLIMIDIVQKLTRRLDVFENLAKKHGVDIKNVTGDEQCTVQ